MAVKSTSIPATKAAAAPAKTGNGKAVQRKVLPGLFAPSMIQRKEQPGSWVHANTQKPVNSRSLVQPKVKVHASDDHYEKEADHIADRVMSNDKAAAPVRVSRVNRAAQRKCASCEKEDKEVQALHVQRKCSSCEETVQTKTAAKKYTANTLESTDSGPPSTGYDTSNHSLDKVLDNQSARGSPLPAATRTQMESRMGADFSNVRIHTGNSSHEANTSIGARAFTNGNNIHFAKGEFNPASKSGQHLLAHELAHTMQQGAAPEKKVAGPTPEPGRKVVAKPKFEKKVAKIPSPYDNKKSAQKDNRATFGQKFKKKKSPRLPGALLKTRAKKLKKEPVPLPKKEKKKPAAPAKVPAKPKHLQDAKKQQLQLRQLASKGISFKAPEDKKAAEDPLQKAQASQSKKISEQVLSKAAQSASSISDTVARVRPRLAQVAGKAIAQVKDNEAAQKEGIGAEIKAQKAAARKAMQSASGSISGYHKKVTGELKAAAVTARADILKAKTDNTNSINDAALLQTPVILKAYTDGQKGFEDSGARIGSVCSQRAGVWSQNYLSTLKYEDDSLLDGPYTDDVKRAKADAATKVGDGYQEGISKAGVDQGAGIHQGTPNDLDKVSQAQEEMLKHLNDSYDTAFKAINTAEEAGIKQADSTKKSMLGSVSTQHKTAQAKLDLTQKTQTQFCEILSKKQSQQIELQAEQATESMEEGGAQSLVHLNNGFKEYRQVCESMNSPPPALLQKQLQPIEASLAQNAPAMAASLQKGMAKTEAGFYKTADEAIVTTNTTVGESLAQAKADNDKAIDGLKKLQSSTITSLQGTLNTNKKTITGTASQCVTDIQAIKTAFDTALTNITSDLSSGLKTGSEELGKGLNGTVDHGQGETKSLAKTSDEEEKKAADQVEPRWKSALKILLVIVVTLLIALVVGPAVIGFIGAAAGGGAFGAAVGAVVGGAILGAASSAVITVGNNLIDGKTWHEGVGKAMLEGAVTGAIGGAFGAAGSGIAGKLIGTAAKGIGPALGRFGISQAVDFAGNVTTEYVSSKIQGKEFSWTAVAQGQAIGGAMHVSMGGLSSLKNVKGFKTINKISEGAGALGESFGNKVRGKAPAVRPDVAPPKTEIEEPKNKGQPKEEPSTAAPKEEPKTPAAKEETPGTTVKEEPKGTAPKEEPKAPAPKEEPLPAAPKEEPKTGAPKEEPHATPKEEPKTTSPDEVTTPGGKKKSELPDNLSNEDVDMGIVGKAPTEDGHHVKLTESGEIIICSNCAKLTDKYAPELADPKVKQEFDKIKSMPENTAKAKDAKAKAARNFDRRMENKLLREYKARNKKSGLTDQQIREDIREGGRMNPVTGRMNKPEMGEPVIDKHATFEKDSAGMPKVDQYDPSKFNDGVKADTDDLLKQRGGSQTLRDAHPEGSPDYKSNQYDVIKASENLGNKAAEGVAHEKGFTGKPKNVGPDFNEGKGTFDRVFEKDGKYLVAEAKGGNSPLKSKEVLDRTGKPIRAQQGTKEYFDGICRDMMSSNNSQKERDLGKALLDASNSGKVEYIMVNQPVDKSNTLGTVKVKTFK